MKKFFILMIFSGIILQAFSQDLIESICLKSDEYGKVIKQYVQIEETKLFYIDENGDKKNEEIIVAERFWKDSKWMRREIKRIKNGVEKKVDSLKTVKEQNPFLYPFKAKDRAFYNYEITEKDGFIHIKANLKLEHQKKSGIEGEFFISKETNYIEKAILSVSKLPFMVKSLKTIMVYAPVSEDLIAPTEIQIEITSKKLLGKLLIVKIENRISYKRKES